MQITPGTAAATAYSGSFVTDCLSLHVIEGIASTMLLILTTAFEACLYLHEQGPWELLILKWDVWGAMSIRSYIEVGGGGNGGGNSPRRRGKKGRREKKKRKRARQKNSARTAPIYFSLNNLPITLKSLRINQK